MIGNRKTRWILGLIIFYATSCTYYKNEIYIPPGEAERTNTLEAVYVTSPPTSISDAYWKTANYLLVGTEEKSSKQLYSEDGILNMNNMYNGKADFNGGNPADLILKAAYDDTYLYVLASWKDNTYNASYGNWLYNGPKDPRSNQDTIGWTSQRNDDNIIFAFEKSGGQDVWKWSLSTSEPIGYALDMQDAGIGWQFDEGTPVFERNAVTPLDFRSGPKFEWNGPKQELTRITGIPKSFAQLDPGYFILNKSDFKGNIVRGDNFYQSQCASCHGENGMGDGDRHNTGIALNVPAKMNRFTRPALDEIIGNGNTHSGAGYWKNLSEEQKNDIIARLRAFAGVPGVAFQTPTGSSADIRAYSNVILGTIDVSKVNPGYTVLFIRKLQTGNQDDIQFNLSESREYNMNIYLTDDDDLNFVGEDGKKLTFE